jgi:hypothetical protein
VSSSSSSSGGGGGGGRERYREAEWQREREAETGCHQPQQQPQRTPLEYEMDGSTGGPSAEHAEQHCGYLAVLPSSPTTSTTDLEATVRSMEARAVSLRWLDARVAELEHPQLTEPLKYIEITCGITLPTAALPDSDPRRDSAVQSALQQIADALMAPGTLVGNVEVVHSIRSPMPLLPAALPTVAAAEDASWMTDGAELFRRFGLVGIHGAVSPSVLAVVRDDVVARFERTLAALKTREAAGEGVHFADIMQRDSSRYDCQLSPGFSLASAPAADAPVWETLAREGAWVPMVRKLLEGCAEAKQPWQVYRCGCVVSLPGAGEQYWHSDGAHQGPAAGWPPPARTQLPAQDLSEWGQAQAAPPHNVCVFVPLVDLNRDNGYTEFWAGTQHYDKLLEKKGVQSLPGGTDAILDAGSVLLYDFRTIHRGMPNSSDAMRPILYFVYSHESWSESRNFRAAAGSVFAAGAAGERDASCCK